MKAGDKFWRVSEYGPMDYAEIVSISPYKITCSVYFADRINILHDYSPEIFKIAWSPFTPLMEALL
jgi:hypothetical protein